MRSRTRRSRALMVTATIAAVLALPALSQATVVLYGSSAGGQLFVVDLGNGSGTAVGRLPDPSTEIECDPTTSSVAPVCYSQLPDGAFQIERFNPITGRRVSGPVNDGFSFTGLEYVGTILYGTAISASNGPSSLRTLNPETGASVLIGATGVGPISGLAYDVGTMVMYGIAGGPGLAKLYTIDLTTGAATVVGNTGIHAGSLQFGPDGNLYAGTTGPDGGEIYRVDPTSGATTLVGDTGFDTVTGLTLADRELASLPAPAVSPLGIALVVLGLLAVAITRIGRDSRHGM